MASVQRTRLTLAGRSAIRCGTNVKRTNANRVIRITAQRTQDLWGPISALWGEMPKHSSTKNSTESEFRYGEKIRYGRSKTLWRGLRSACFSRQKRQENGTESEKLRRRQNTTDSSAVLFLVRKGPLGMTATLAIRIAAITLAGDSAIPCPSFPCSFWKKARKTTKKQGFFTPSESLKSPGKEKRPKKQGILRRGK